MDLYTALRQLTLRNIYYLQKMNPITKKMISFKLIRPYSQFTNKPANLIRNEFLDYFTKDLKHSFIRSSPVSPITDQSLAFINAGMNQVRFFDSEKLVSDNEPADDFCLLFSLKGFS